MTNASKLTEANLRQFTGTEHWYRHPINRKVLYTDGVKYVAHHGRAYWLLDEIALLQPIKIFAEEPFQVWKLAVNDRTGMLTCEDGDARRVHSRLISYPTFPLPEITLYCTDGVILLPSEY